MQALKCDRCKQFYEPHDDINGMTFVVNDYTNKSYRFKKIFDLCPACVRQLERFVNGEEECQNENKRDLSEGAEMALRGFMNAIYGDD